MNESMYEMIRRTVDGIVENPVDSEEEEQFDPLSVELQRSIVIWITYGGPNIWIEIPIDSGSATINGRWGSDSAEYTLSQKEEAAVLEALGIYDIDEYASSILHSN